MVAIIDMSQHKKIIDTKNTNDTASEADVLRLVGRQELVEQTINNHGEIKNFKKIEKR